MNVPATPRPLSYIESLNHSTVRITCKRGRKTSAGTGFLFDLTSEGSPHRFVLVTNRHVVEGYPNIGIRLGGLPWEGDLVSEVVSVPGGDDWIKHPDPTIDLCCIDAGPILRRTTERLFV